MNVVVYLVVMAANLIAWLAWANPINMFVMGWAWGFMVSAFLNRKVED